MKNGKLEEKTDEEKKHEKKKENGQEPHWRKEITVAERGNIGKKEKSKKLEKETARP